MTHKFKDEIIDWLNGGKYEGKLVDGGDFWSEINILSAFDVASEIRKVDEYKHLRDALARGETLQVLHDDDEVKWIDIYWEPHFSEPDNEYRIKPKTKKMVQWLMQDMVDGSFYPSNAYCEVGNKPKLSNRAKPIKPIPNTEIEVEE